MFGDELLVRCPPLGDDSLYRLDLCLCSDGGRDVARDRALARDKGRLLWTFAGFWS